MIGRRFSARDRRALRLGLMCAVPIVVWTFGVRPYMRHLDDVATAIDRERSLLVRERQLLALAPAFASRMEAAREVLDEHRSANFQGTDPAMATAEFAAWVADRARHHQVRMDRTQPRDFEESPAGTELRLALTASGDVNGVMRWLHALESGTRLIVVERLEIRRSEGQEAAPLELSMSLLGFAASASAEAER